MNSAEALYEEEKSAADLVDQKRFDEAQELLFRLSEGGSIYASMTLGWLYEMGKIGVRNPKAAKYFYEQAVRAGSAEACWRLGRLFADDKQLAQSRDAFKTGVERGDLASMHRYGMLMLESNEDQSGRDEGMSWLKLAADEGHFFAQRELITLEIARLGGGLKPRIAALPRLISLAVRVVREACRDINSDKLKG